MRLSYELRVEPSSTGDWKLDPHPIEGEHYDGRLLSLGESGIEFVIGDSTNATIEDGLAQNLSAERHCMR